MNPRSFAFATLLTAVFGFGNAGDLEPYQFAQSLTGEAAEREIGVVKLSADVFRYTQSDFADLRLIREFDEAKEEVSYLVVPGSAEKKSTARLLAAEVEQFEQRPDGGIEVTIKLKEERAAGTLRIETSLRDFEKSVRIEGSAERESWEVLVEDSLIVDYTRFIDFRRTEVTLPANSYRYFRISIAAATDQQQSLVTTLRETVSDSAGVAVESAKFIEKRNFKIDRFVFLTPEEEEENDATMRFPVEIKEAAFNAERKRTETQLMTGKAPLVELEVETVDTNFRREVELQARRGDEWETVQHATIHRYEIGDFRDEQLKIPVPSTAWRADQYRLLIHHGDSAPVTLADVEGIGLVHELFFIGAPVGKWSLFFGAEPGSVKKPNYDAAAIRAGRLRETALKSFESGVLAQNPAFKLTRSPIHWSEQKWLLWGVLILVVAGLGRIILATAKQVEEAG